MIKVFLYFYKNNNINLIFRKHIIKRDNHKSQMKLILFFKNIYKYIQIIKKKTEEPRQYIILNSWLANMCWVRSRVQIILKANFFKI